MASIRSWNGWPRRGGGLEDRFERVELVGGLVAALPTALVTVLEDRAALSSERLIPGPRASQVRAPTPEPGRVPQRVAETVQATALRNGGDIGSVQGGDTLQHVAGIGGVVGVSDDKQLVRSRRGSRRRTSLDLSSSG